MRDTRRPSTRREVQNFLIRQSVVVGDEIRLTPIFPTSFTMINRTAVTIAANSLLLL